MVELRPPRRQRNYRNLSFGAGVAEIHALVWFVSEFVCLVALRYFGLTALIHLMDKNISRNYYTSVLYCAKWKDHAVAQMICQNL